MRVQEALLLCFSACKRFGERLQAGECFSAGLCGYKTVNVADQVRHVLAPDLVLAVADDELANTALMQQLRDAEGYTVAQFAQAIGAIHYANFRLRTAVAGSRG